MDTEAGLREVVDRLDTETVFYAMFEDPDWTHTQYDDLSVFRYEDGGEPVVYAADEDRFWTPEEYRSSPLGVLGQGETKRVTVFETDADGLPTAVQHNPNGYDGDWLFDDVYRQATEAEVVVFEQYDDEPVVFDAAADRFMDVDDYRDTLYYALEAADAPDQFCRLMREAEEAVSHRNRLCHFLNPGRNGVATAMAVAADGEGLVAARSSDHTIEEESYVLVHMLAGKQYEWRDTALVSVEAVQDITFPTSEMPGGWSRNRKLFARDQLIKQYADRKGEVAADFEEGYLLAPTTRLSTPQ